MGKSFVSCFLTHSVHYTVEKWLTDVDDDDIVVVVGIECYQLESVSRLRKYLSFVELGLSFLTSRVMFVSGWSELVKAQVTGHSLSFLCLLRLFFITLICHMLGFPGGEFLQIGNCGISEVVVWIFDPQIGRPYVGIAGIKQTAWTIDCIKLSA